MENDIESLTHTKWRFQYRVAPAPRYRRKARYGKLKADIRKILRVH